MKVGDIVWCIKKDTYSITDYHVMCVVVEYDPVFRVKLYKDESNVFPVCEKYFELCASRAI